MAKALDGPVKPLVADAAPSDGDVLTYDNAKGGWKPAAPSGGASVEESTLETDFSGATGGPFLLRIKKIGNIVMISVPEFGGTLVSGALESAEVLPAELRPSEWVNTAFLVMDNSTDKVGTMFVNPDGVIRFGSNTGGNLSAGPYYVNSCTIVYTLA